MSPAIHVRQGAFYLLLGMLAVVIVGNMAMTGLLWDLYQGQDETERKFTIGCERANNTRDAAHWNTLQNIDEADARGDFQAAKQGELVLAGLNLGPNEHPRADKPWLVDCTKADG